MEINPQMPLTNRSKSKPINPQGNIREYFKQKLLGITINILRIFNSFSLYEYRQYKSIEDQLNYYNPVKIEKSIPSFSLDHKKIRESLAKRDNYRIINPTNLSTEDEYFLQKNKISKEYILKNTHPTNKPISTSNKNNADNLKPDHTNFQKEAFKSGHISATCPITGELLHTNRSLIPDQQGSIFYRFLSKNNAFYLSVGRDGFGYIKLYLYFPNIKTVILLGDSSWTWLGRWEIDIFRSFLISNHLDVLKYINNKKKPICCALIDNGHFAHHIWNTLTGISTACDNSKSNLIDFYLVSNEPMGPINELFPGIDKNKIRRTNDSEIKHTTLSENLFIIRPGGTIVTKKIVERIHNVAIENSTSEFNASAKLFREKHYPILWATIRTGGRTWLSQAEGIALIANKLKKKYPKFALIIDGYALPFPQHTPDGHVAQLLKSETEVLNRINMLLDPSIDTRAFIGQPILSSVVYAGITDLYLAHHGAIQHKIAWLSNKPGVIHSNRSIISKFTSSKSSNYAATKAIKGFTPPTYLGLQVVTDSDDNTATDSSFKWDASLCNYDFNYQHALDSLNKILDHELK